MSVDYYVCERCGETFPDCMDGIVWCECGNVWCCLECAYKDGYQFGVEVDEDGEEYETEEGSSCKYCRGEEFYDNELLEYSLELLQMTKEELVIKLKEHKQSIEKED